MEDMGWKQGSYSRQEQRGTETDRILEIVLFKKSEN
jgi:hypothetical protein